MPQPRSTISTPGTGKPWVHMDPLGETTSTNGEGGLADYLGGEHGGGAWAGCNLELLFGMLAPPTQGFRSRHSS